jgi:hypothetical protein
MVLVDPQHRRQGIAAQLLKVAFDYLKDKVATIKLDATALGQPVYEKLGFEVESKVERWTGNSSGRATQSEAVIDRAALLDLDRLAFNADRSQLIERLIADACVPPVLIRAVDGALSGYALARSGTRKTYVGPVVANDSEVTETLLDRMLSQLPGHEVYVDINRECLDDTRMLSDRGFVKERDLVRMVKGGPTRKTSPMVVAIAGPEVG